MCGIAGFLNLDRAPASAAIAQKMADRLAHRGPDADGVWTEGPLALAHRRLAIRELSPGGAQPFASECGRIVVVYNGEIYNDRAISDRLARATGFRRRTTADTEIIPAAYLAWGLDAFAMFEGMFAIGLWDRRERTLVLARDAVGIKPLYIAETPCQLAFASEVKAFNPIQSSGFTLSPSDLSHLLAQGYIAPDRSLVLGVRQVPPGSMFIHRDGVSEERKFWSPRRHARITSMSDAVVRLTETLKQVVDDQLVSDVPIGSLQSSGIDSSLVTMCLPRQREVPLFSVSFPERSHDESSGVAALAKAAGRNVAWIRLSDSAETAEDFVSCALAVDGQLGDSSALAFYQLAREVRRHVKVVLSGDGGDEFFGGYPTYRASSLAASSLGGILPSRLFAMLATGMRRAARVSEGRLTIQERIYRLLYGLSQPIPHVVWRHYLANDERDALYGPVLLDELHRDPFSGYAKAFHSSSGNVTDRAMLADQSYYLPGDMLVKADRISMAHGLEVRVPLLDRRIMDFAAELDPKLFFGADGRATKQVLRATLRTLMAPEIIASARKRGFNVPMNLLLRGALRPMAEHYLTTNADIFRPFLRADTVRLFWRQHASGSIDRKYLLWTLLTLAVWLDRGVSK